MPILTIFYISLAFLLLYDCSANSYNSYNSYNSNNIYYSDYFKSGSKHFNSNFFNSGSTPFNYISLVNYNIVSSKSHIYSILYSSLNHKSFVSSTPYLTLINSYSFIQSQQKSYITSDAHTYITHIPTLSPTVAPTSNMPIFDPLVIAFTTDISLSNVQTNYLDGLAQQSVVIATANSMNISVDFVSFVSSSVSKDVKIGGIQLLSFNLIATTKTSIPLVGKYSIFTSDPSSLFTSLSNTMTAAVANGAFTNYLVATSLQLNSSATASASVSSIKIVQINATLISPTSSPTILNQDGNVSGYQKTNYYYILLYIFGSFISFWLLVYIAIVYRRFYIRKQIDLRRYMLYLPHIIRRIDTVQRSTLETRTLENDSNNDIKNTEDIILLIDNK